MTLALANSRGLANSREKCSLKCPTRKDFYRSWATAAVNGSGRTSSSLVAGLHTISLVACACECVKVNEGLGDVFASKSMFRVSLTALC